MTHKVLYIQPVGCEGPGLIEATRPEGLTVEVCRPLIGHPIPARASEYAAIVALGGPMGVYETEKYPWLSELLRLLRNAIEVQVPVLGICLGSQALAAAAGAVVRPAGIQEIGWRPITLLEDSQTDPLLAGLPESLPAFHWHGDRWELPPDAVLLAKSELCDHQAFRLGKFAWGFQFHLEVTEEPPLVWAEAYHSDLEGHADRPQPEEIAITTARDHAILAPNARKVFERFWSVVVESYGTERAVHD